MTSYLVDVASYQGALTVEDCIRAGFDVINLKISHGLTQRSVHPDIAGLVSDATHAGLDICTFHFLTGDVSGEIQASYAFHRMQVLGLIPGTVHVVDVETNPVGPNANEAIVRAYLNKMQWALDRPVMVYTGDHFWKPRGWNLSDLTPYLHAAPNAGYLGDYPGDSSPHWTAKYGGWEELAVMQYAVQPLEPGGTIKVSKSAIRDQRVWAALKGGEPVASWILIEAGKSLFRDFDLLAPSREKASDGSVGNLAHQQSVSDHNPDETGSVPISDADNINEVHAIDVDKDLRESDLTMEKVVQFLLGRCRSGAERRLRYIIFNKRIWSASSDWVQKPYTGANDHSQHAHFSFSYVTSLEASAASWKLEEIPVALTQADKDYIDAKLEAVVDEVKKLVGDVVVRWDATGANIPSTDPNPTVQVSTALNQVGRTVARVESKLNAMTPPSGEGS